MDELRMLSLSDLSKTDEQATKLLVGIYSSARKCIEKDGECAPLVLVYPVPQIVPEGELQTCVPLPVNEFMRNGHSKDELRRFINTLLTVEETAAVAFISEAWTVMQETPASDVAGALARVQRGESLAEHPDRTEIVMVTLYRRGKPAIVAHATLTHKPDKIGEVRILPNENTTGRFADDAGGLDQPQH